MKGMYRWQGKRQETTEFSTQALAMPAKGAAPEQATYVQQNSSEGCAGDGQFESDDAAGFHPQWSDLAAWWKLNIISFVISIRCAREFTGLFMPNSVRSVSENDKNRSFTVRRWSNKVQSSTTIIPESWRAKSDYASAVPEGNRHRVRLILGSKLSRDEENLRR